MTTVSRVRGSVIIATLILTGLVSRAAADAPSLSAGVSSTPEPADAFDCDGDVGWIQLPDGGYPLSSQDDQCYPFLSEVADDFLGHDASIVGIGWWGHYWAGTPLRPDGFDVTYYLDDAGRPGEVVHEEWVTEYNETPGLPIFGYCATFDDPVAFASGCTFHVSIVAFYCFPPQWGVASGDGNEIEAHFRSEFFGYPDWVPAGEVIDRFDEMAFVHLEASGAPPPARDGGFCCLPDGTCVPLEECEVCPGRIVDDCASCGSTPSSRSSWGRVKRLYR